MRQINIPRKIMFGPARRLLILTVFAVSSANHSANAQDEQPAGAASSESAVADAKADSTKLAAAIRKSIVVVRATGRDGREYGHGTGFVISSDGLIATARHVIGDRRSVRIELPDGKQIPVTHIHAVTEAVDLAVLKVDAKDLTALPLGNVENANAGQPVVTVGFPGRPQYSFFQGLISGRHSIDGISMLKLAMTVEPGSSGEPVVTTDGKVVGIVTLKSRESNDVGFAVPVDHLKSLLEDPASIAMSRWMTIGALDKKQWTVLWGANWRQRASRILVEGYGSAFGGRSLCLNQMELPKRPFEIQVDIRLDDESGAAGLAFHADGDDKHYGFYPSAGKVRLTRFNGPDLNSWTILFNEATNAYRPDEWNTFKVRIEKDQFRCFVNEQLIVKSKDKILPSGLVGLATFRGTSASFRRFQVAEKIPSAQPSADDAGRIAEILKDVKASQPASIGTVARMQPFGIQAGGILEAEARMLEQRARHIRELAKDVHTAQTIQKIMTALGRTNKAEQPPDLLKAALLVAVLDNSEIEPDGYIKQIERLVAEATESVAPDASEADRLQALEQLLFREYGFRGSRYEYYTRSNSYLNEVIDDREGLPISLSVLFMELARRMDLNVVGIGLPGHFLVRYEPKDGDSDSELIDVFARGKRVSKKEAESMIRDRGFPLLPRFFEAQTPEQIIERMIINLLALAERNREDSRVLRYLEVLVALDEDNPEHRAKRLEMRARTGRLAASIEDADWFINEQPEGTNADQLYELRARLQRELDALTE